MQKEIQEKYRGEEMKTLYIGGGTPSALSLEELENLMDIMMIFKKANVFEYTFECNIENITKEKLLLLKEYGVNRLSVGVQTSHEKYLKFLNRSHTKELVREKVKEMKALGFSNINIDFMYAFPNESVEEVREDIDFFLSLNVPHVSTYSLIIEPHTLLGIKNIQNIDSDVDAQMYETIKKSLKEHGYIHYETSNFAKKGYESKHNLTYWNNEEYYGFGVSASGFVEAIRYENTKSLTEYIKGNFVSSKSLMSKVDNMENELILGFRKLEGINLEHFFDKFEENMQNIFPIKPLIKSGDLIYKDGYVYINPKKLYVMNEILIKLI